MDSMAQLKDDDLLNVYNEIFNQDKCSEFNKLRKITILKHSSAMHSLDNKNICLLLDNNLKKFTNKTLMTEQDLCKISRNNAVKRKFNIRKNQVDSLIENLSCSSKPVCEKSENISEGEFQEFMALFNEKRSRCVATEQKHRMFAKSFVPQTCNTKGRFTKHIKENVNISNNSEINDELHQYGNFADNSTSCFKTAREEMNIQKKQGQSYTGGQKRKLGTRRGVGSKFISPLLSNESNEDSSSKSQEWADQIVDERLKNLEPRMIELIKSEIMDNGPLIDWNDIAGLDFAKTAIQEAVVWPMLRPDIFTGLRRPPKGILLFGPPGTGKTLIGKCVASQSKSTFFSISASSLTSKWVGDGEKMVRALFTVARCHQPAVIFIDEIDSLLSQRTDTEHECSRRIKTEFLVQLDGAATDNDEKLLVIGATNRPQELDEAARRRFVKRLYIPLPEIEARRQLVERLMRNEKHQLNEENIMEIAKLSEGYSGADIRNLCSEASMGPIRSIDMNLIHSIQTAEVRPVNMDDFKKALTRVRSSVSSNDLDQYVTWNKTYGSQTLH